MSTLPASRFEQSFVFHLIRDFFLLLLLVAAVELGLRYAALLYQFRTAEAERVARAAEQLAADVKSIMLNSGGPLAAQTVYPILNRNYDDLGLTIAVEPSQVTVESIKAALKMDAQGLKPVWPEGAHQQSTVALRAEQFCLGCHVKAQVGDVLGTVSVRSYLARKEEAWWQEVRVAAGALSLKILVHTILLLLLLKVRMAPMLALRGTVAALAKGVMDLSPRARVKSEDEFGELAEDLNHFLDRISLIVHDLDQILSEVLAVGERLSAVNRRLERQLDGLRVEAVNTLAEGAQRGLEARVAAAREAGAFGVLLRQLDEGVAGQPLPGELQQRLRAPIERLQQRFDEVTQALERAVPAVPAARAQAGEYEAFAQSLREMSVLETTMQAVAESGQRLLQRLAQGRSASGALSRPE
jgi:methyl-accepting chemotaxis protein